MCFSSDDSDVRPAPTLILSPAGQYAIEVTHKVSLYPDAHSPTYFGGRQPRAGGLRGGRCAVV